MTLKVAQGENYWCQLVESAQLSISGLW